MRRPIVIVFIASLISYLGGIYAHAFRIFPVDELRVVKRWALREPGRPTSHGEVFSDASRREQVSCWAIDRNSVVILAMGQSNAANYAGHPYRPVQQVFAFNWADGRCYRAEDPLLGATGTRGSVWSRLGDALIESGRFKEVLIVPVAVAGTSVRDWTGDAGPAARAVQAAKTLDQYGLKITHVLWHQGESDYQMQKEVYERLFRGVMKYIRSSNIDAPVFIATTSICNNYGADQIRQAQRELPQLLDNVFAGPDTDAIDSIFDRTDNLCHFSDRGAAVHARLWLDVVLRHSAAEKGQMVRPTASPP